MNFLQCANREFNTRHIVFRLQGKLLWTCARILLVNTVPWLMTLLCAKSWVRFNLKSSGDRIEFVPNRDAKGQYISGNSFGEFSKNIIKPKNSAKSYLELHSAAHSHMYRFSSPLNLNSANLTLCIVQHYGTVWLKGLHAFNQNLIILLEWIHFTFFNYI